MLLRVQAQGVIDRRVVANTRKHYDGHIRKLTTWLKQSHPNLVEEISTSSSSTAPASNLRIKLPLQAQVILNYLVSTQRNCNGKLVATSTMTGIGSAINDMYRSRGLQISEQIKAKLNQFMAGHRRMVADAKQQGQLPMFEGKRPLSHTGYLNLAKYALKTQSSRVGSLFPHTFIVLAWNLFARSHSVAALMLNHFEWMDDALMVTVPKHKGDQEELEFILYMFTLIQSNLRFAAFLLSLFMSFVSNTTIQAALTKREQEDGSYLEVVIWKAGLVIGFKIQ